MYTNITSRSALRDGAVAVFLQAVCLHDVVQRGLGLLTGLVSVLEDALDLHLRGGAVFL